MWNLASSECIKDNTFCSFGKYPSRICIHDHALFLLAVEHTRALLRYFLELIYVHDDVPFILKMEHAKVSTCAFSKFLGIRSKYYGAGFKQEYCMRFRLIDVSRNTKEYKY